MRKLITLSIAVLFIVSGFAAVPDRFQNIKETIGKQIVIYDAASIQSQFGNFLYSDQNGKLKPIKDAALYPTVLSNTKVFKVTGVTIEKNKEYLEICNEDETYFLLLSPKINYCDHIRSYTYWEQTFERYQSDYQYKGLDTHNSSVNPNKQYTAIEWQEFIMPENMVSDVIFQFTEENLDPESSQIERKISRSLPFDVIEHTGSKYIKRDEYRWLTYEYEKAVEQARLDSIADTRPIVAHILYTYSSRTEFDKNDRTLDSDDDYKISLFLSYSTGSTQYFKGFCTGSEMSFKESDLRFVNPKDADYLKRRKSDGQAVRREVARVNDELYADHLLDSLKTLADKALEDLQKMKRFYRTKKIFITGQEYVFGDYGRFGLRFKFYNPWDKQIKYIVLTLTPYNAVDDIQRDDVGRGRQDVRCIGPIDPDTSGTYEFEKIYWDEKDIISRVDVTNVKITFKDNSTVVYSSKSQIDTHRSSRYSLAEMGITD